MLTVALAVAEAVEAHGQKAACEGDGVVEVLLAPIAVPIPTTTPGMPFTARFGCFDLSEDIGPRKPASRNFPMTGADFDLIRSGRENMIPETTERRTALDAFVAELAALGFEPAGKGPAWYNLRLRRPTQ